MLNLQYYKTFDEDSSQGLVGLLRPSRDPPSAAGCKHKAEVTIGQVSNQPLDSSTLYFYVQDEPLFPIFVFKVPLEVSSLADHEYAVSKDLERLMGCLPHFNRVVDIKRDVRCSLRDRKSEGVCFNPFKPNDGFSVSRDVSILEYIPSKTTLLQFVKKKQFGSQTRSLLHQLVLAIFIAQQEIKFSHYDLHLENVLIRKCVTRTFFLYKFEFGGVQMSRLLFSGGFFPVLFDYGFAFSEGLNYQSFKNSFYYSNKGYTPFVFDDTVDFRMLMVRLHGVRGCPKDLREFVEDTFLHGTIKVDKETGWVKSKTASIGRTVSKKLLEYFPNRGFLNKYLDEIVDLFGTLIKLPIDTRYSDPSEGCELHEGGRLRAAKGSSRPASEGCGMQQIVDDFVNEFAKIETWFTSSDDKLNVLRKVINLVDQLISQIPEGAKTVSKKHFKIKMFQIFDSFGEFVDVQNLNYEKFLLSLVELSNYIENVVWAEYERYEKTFKVGSAATSWELFQSIESFFEPTDPHAFAEGDSVVVFDCVDKTTSSFDIVDKHTIKVLNSQKSVNGQIEFIMSLHFEEETL